MASLRSGRRRATSPKSRLPAGRYAKKQTGYRLRMWPGLAESLQSSVIFKPCLTNLHCTADQEVKLLEVLFCKETFAWHLDSTNLETYVLPVVAVAYHVSSNSVQPILKIGIFGWLDEAAWIDASCVNDPFQKGSDKDRSFIFHVFFSL